MPTAAQQPMKPLPRFPMAELTTPRRIQRSRAAGWRMPAGAVYVGRPSKWGNQYVLERWGSPHHWEGWYVCHADLGAVSPDFRTKVEARSRLSSTASTSMPTDPGFPVSPKSTRSSGTVTSCAGVRWKSPTASLSPAMRTCFWTSQQAETSMCSCAVDGPPWMPAKSPHPAWIATPWEVRNRGQHQWPALQRDRADPESAQRSPGRRAAARRHQWRRSQTRAPLA